MIIINYIIEPAIIGTAAFNINGMGNLICFWRALFQSNPAGIPKITPYQKPFSYVCLKCSKATFIDETSYESYLKSVIFNIYVYLDKGLLI
jgi:hypothetical protein